MFTFCESAGSLRSVLQNVLSFDSFEEQLQNTLVEVFYKHGIPAGPVCVSCRAVQYCVHPC